mgnify:CR=1 FL=1
MEKLTPEEVRDRTHLPDLDATLEELGYSLDEAVERQTNIGCTGGVPQNGSGFDDTHIPAPTFRLVNLHCLICGNVIEVRQTGEDMFQEYELKHS